MSDTPSLGQRWLAACADLPSGGWACGMLLLPEPDSPEPGGPARVVSVRDGCVTVAWEAGAGCADGGTLLRGDVPDLSDPATIGAALGILRAWSGDPRLYLRPHGGEWEAESPAEADTLATGATEAEAIVAAAEALAARGGGR